MEGVTESEETRIPLRNSPGRHTRWVSELQWLRNSQHGFHLFFINYIKMETGMGLELSMQFGGALV